MRKRRVAGLIAIATIVLFIALDLPSQNFLTHLITLICLLFIGWCFFSKTRK